MVQTNIRQGKLKVSRYEDKTSAQLTYWYKMVADYMREKNMLETPDCSYARFVRDKIPVVWEMLKKIRFQAQISFLELLDKLDNELLQKMLMKKDVINFVLTNGTDNDIAEWIDNIRQK